MKNTWKGIRSIISLQKTSNDSPNIISLEDHTVTDPQTIANTFNNFHIKLFLNIYHRLTKTRFSSHLVQKKK